MLLKLCRCGFAEHKMAAVNVQNVVHPLKPFLHLPPNDRARLCLNVRHSLAGGGRVHAIKKHHPHGFIKSDPSARAVRLQSYFRRHARIPSWPNPKARGGKPAFARAPIPLEPLKFLWTAVTGHRFQSTDVPAHSKGGFTRFFGQAATATCRVWAISSLAICRI